MILSMEEVMKIDLLRQWVNDLQSGMYVNCVYCGHRYGPEKYTPASMADVLKEHIEQCPEHPMSKLKQENEQLRQDVEQHITWNEAHTKARVEQWEEIKQLRGQVAAMREVFEEYHINWCGSAYCNEDCQVKDCALRKLGMLCLSADAGDYHNPADIEVLKLAKQVLHRAYSHIWVHDCNNEQLDDEFKESIMAIEKVIGGQENEI